MLLYNMALAHVLSSSDDEDFANIVNRRPKNVRRRPAHFYEFDDIDFHARFRLSKECITEAFGSYRTRNFTSNRTVSIRSITYKTEL